jgi:hypothetical protein
MSGNLGTGIDWPLAILALLWTALIIILLKMA